MMEINKLMISQSVRSQGNMPTENKITVTTCNGNSYSNVTRLQQGVLYEYTTLIEGYCKHWAKLP